LYDVEDVGIADPVDNDGREHVYSVIAAGGRAVSAARSMTAHPVSHRCDRF
jgi:hypothetical protein